MLRSDSNSSDSNSSDSNSSDSNPLAFTKTVEGQLEDVIQKVTEAIKPAGFGLLTRIDFDKTIKQKLGESIKPCTILGACNPKLAFEAYQSATDAALLLPCNIVITEISPGTIRIEAMRPKQMLKTLPHLEQAIQSDSLDKAEFALQAAIANV